MVKKTLAFALASGMMLLALPAYAQKTPTATQVACVATAVGARETSLDSGITTFTQAMSAAYSARATALQQAYTLTPGGSAIKNAIKAAWAAFSASMKSARGTWQSTRSSAWSKFRTAVKACKAPSVTTDSGNSGSEASGN